jgi:HEAT repeat protein
VTAAADDHDRRVAVVIAGHSGDLPTARRGLADPDPEVRAAAIGALERLGRLERADLVAHLRPDDEPSVVVRRRAAEAVAHFSDIGLLEVLDDPEWSVVEMACWSVGEHEAADDATLDRLVSLATDHDESLVREAAVAALGAVGDPRALPAIIAATHDRATVRRRAAVALAPFDSDDAEDALRRLLEDRDWQTRQIAEDLLDARPG